jgi:predicted dehydrogenase
MGCGVTTPVGVALLGCAHTQHAWSYARALAASPAARLVGVYDGRPELAEPISRSFDVPLYSEAAALLERSDVEAVVICSATVQHRPMVQLAAARGLHVLCEKPIATTLDDARAMLAACEQSGVQLHLAFVTRFLPLVQQVRSAIVAGDLGDLIAMVAGNRGRPPLPPLYPDWITTASESGGGALIDHSVHLTDVMRHLSGREVVRVGAEVDSRLWDIGVDDVALMSLVFDDGMVASVDPSWSVPAGNPWDYDFYLRIVGTRGSLAISDLAESVQLVSSHTGGGLRLVPFGEDVDVALVEAFVASVRADEILGPCADGAAGLRALEIALAGYAAADAGATVSLPLDVTPRA